MRPRVSIIMLNWNQEADTTECLQSLSKVSYDNFGIILIDNGSTDGSAVRLKVSFPDLTLIENGQNLGFAEGCNIGIKRAMERKADYILLLNNDTTVEPDFLELLVESAQSDKMIGISSPKIMFYHDRSKIWFVGGRFLLLLRKPAHWRYGEPDYRPLPEFLPADWVSGCCMLIKREVVEEVGLLDADYFNNYEDVDFCVRVKKAGYKIAVATRAKIYHKFAASFGGKFSPAYTYFRTRNNLLFFKKTRQWLPLALNFIIFPLYSIAASIGNLRFDSVGTTFLALRDFLAGNYGLGSAERLTK